VPGLLYVLQNDCPKGQLTREKFLQVYSSFFPQGNAERFCEHVFRTFDSDQSGKIDFREFLLAINITSSGNPEQKLDWAFHMYDVNGDGSIEPSEMAEIIRVSSVVFWLWLLRGALWLVKVSLGDKSFFKAFSEVYTL
jgi:Ca2+-binding EF-hand superfamily protein